MRPLLSFFLIFVMMAFSAQTMCAQEPQKKPEFENVPAPKLLIVPQPFPAFRVPERPRPETREVWSYYGVDSFGRFRPRVIMAPYGSSYYMYNGEPYPWVTNRPTRVMPKVAD
jgi:hypothetical protein